MTEVKIGKNPGVTRWSEERDQTTWFTKFKSNDAEGLRFDAFQNFLQATVYEYLKSFAPNANKIDDDSRFTHQQEMQIFKTFDQKNDHILDFDEFSFMCHRWLDKIYKPTSALIIVDVQNDFIDGSLALINGPAGQDGVEVVPVINSLLEADHFKVVVYTQDWHPADHIGFHSNLPLRKYKTKNNPDVVNGINGKNSTGNELDRAIQGNLAEAKEPVNEPLKYNKMDLKVNVFDTVLFDDGRIEQKLWPTHCVQNSWGAQLHPKLKIVHDSIHIQKGTLAHVDAYSAFWDNSRMNETGLRQELSSRNVSDLYFCGLALDYCVSASALDSAKAGFMTFVIEDACRGIDFQEMECRKQELREHGVLIINSTMIPGLMANIDMGYEFNGYSDGNLNVAPKSGIDQPTMKSICLRRALI